MIRVKQNHHVNAPSGFSINLSWLEKTEFRKSMEGLQVRI